MLINVNIWHFFSKKNWKHEKKALTLHPEIK